jgi:hypothetical protein
MKKTFFIALVIGILALAVPAFATDAQWTTAITVTPAPPLSTGVAATVTANFRIFDGAIDNLHVIGGVVGGATLYDQTFPHLINHAITVATFTWTPSSSGTYTLYFQIDPSATSADTNASNNRVELVVSVTGGGAGQPNLKPVVSYTPTDFSAGNNVEFSIKVNNLGTVPSVACQMEMKKGSSVLHTFNVPVISASGHWDTTWNWTAECDAALSLKVDSNNANAESNEGDNTWSHTMACGDTGGGGIFVCIPCLKFYKFVEFQPIPLPDPCLSCPPWHIKLKRGDPIDILNGIGDKLGNGIGFEGVKGDWMKFLGNHHGLTPNAALKIIFDRAVLGAKGKFRNEGAAKLFREGLNNSLGQLHGLALEKFNVK